MTVTARVLLAAGLLVAPGGASARDYGQQGATFPVIEVDILKAIEMKLRRAEASGEIAAMNRGMAKRAEARVRRPKPVPGISAARERRSWAYDPTITVQQDIRDAKGRLIIARGARVNPLDKVPMRTSLVFIDGDDSAQVRWAFGSTTAQNSKIILVKGAPLALMDASMRRVYFDQDGTITGKFGIRHVPAVVEPAGRVLRVTEMPIGANRGAGA